MVQDLEGRRAVPTAAAPSYARSLAMPQAAPAGKGRVVSQKKSDGLQSPGYAPAPSQSSVPEFPSWRAVTLTGLGWAIALPIGLAIGLAIGWALVRALGLPIDEVIRVPIGEAIGGIEGAPLILIDGIVSPVSIGLLGGFISTLVWRKEKSLAARGRFGVILGWAVAWAIGVPAGPIIGSVIVSAIGLPVNETTIRETVGMIIWALGTAISGVIVGTIGGCVTALTWRKGALITAWRNAFWVTLGWAIAWAIGLSVALPVGLPVGLLIGLPIGLLAFWIAGENIAGTTIVVIALVIGIAISGACSGAIGGAISAWRLRSEARNRNLLSSPF